MERLYDFLMSPLERRWLAKHRTQLMAIAEGNVLEIGFGTGANLNHYVPRKINSLTVLDLEPQKSNRDQTDFKFSFVTGKAEKLPFEDNSFDTVVETLVFCSVSDLEATVSEVIRVLKPGGKFIFMDHVLPDQKVMATVFKGINILWPHIAHGCNLIREPHLAIEKHRLTMIESGTFGKGIFRYGVVQKQTE